MIQRKDYLSWLYPGLGVKRWIFGGLLGIVVMVIGVWNMINNQYTREFAVALVNWLEKVFPDLGYGAGVISFLGGLFLLLLSVYFFGRQSVVRPSSQSHEAFYRWKMLRQGPKIVVIGGGTGLAVLLRGLKEYTCNITAVVSVADDGGSSGRLREEYGVVPVGDIRSCIVALSDEEDVMEKLFHYRFEEGKELGGHSLGNLLLLAMSNLKGSFQDAVADIDQVLHIRGRVLPVAKEPLTLKAKLDNGVEIVGESNVCHAWSPIEKMILCPEDAQPLPEVLTAITQADVVILGPGSLYTSIIPNLLVTGITDQIDASKALKFYVCNVMTQAGETDGFAAEDHLSKILDHSREDLLDYIVVNHRQNIHPEVLERYQEEGASPVEYDKKILQSFGVQVLEGDLLNQQQVLRHDSKKLSKLIIETMYNDRKYIGQRGIYKTFWDRQKLKEK